MKAVVDTNVFIYSLDEDSEFHEAAKELLFSFDEWIVPGIVFYELFWFLKDNGLDIEEITPLVLQILNSPRCSVIDDNEKHLRSALEL